MLPFITDYIFIVATGAPLGLSISGTGLLLIVTISLENLRAIDSRALMVTYDDYGKPTKKKLHKKSKKSKTADLTLTAEN